METKYIPLYRKYRPQTFNDLIGQENIVHALGNAIKLNRIAHAYLLCGPRGTGKTSSARILAKSLNCIEGPTLTPCGKCPACLDIMNSIPVDVIEIDAASNRSVEDTQAIIEKIQYVPVNGKYKIYIIDEVHMLSSTAFNSLLKTLEEPPQNVIFILATTEPHKVLDTIISRCQRFDYRRITTDDIVKRLEYISAQENINITKDALYNIAKNSQGGMRDALSFLDQISVLGANKEITTEDVNELLGKISYEKLYQIADCIINAETSKSIELIDEVYAKGNEPVQLVNNLIQYFRDLMIIKNCSDKELIYSLTLINEINYEKNKALADKFTVSEIIQIIDKLSYYTVQIKDTTNKYLWLELCIIDITNYKNLPSMENLMKRIETLEAQIASGVPVNNKPALALQTDASPVVKRETVIKNEIQNNNSEQEAINLPQKNDLNREILTEKQPEQNPSSVNNRDLHNIWVSVLQSITNNAAKAFYQQKAQPVELSENRILIAFPNEMFVKMAENKTKKQALADAVTSYLGFKNPNIQIITTADIPSDFVPVQTSNPVSLNTSVSEQKENMQDIQKKEEEEYQTYVEDKNNEEKTVEKHIDTSSQAGMVKDLFDGKFIE